MIENKAQGRGREVFRRLIPHIEYYFIVRSMIALLLYDGTFDRYAFSKVEKSCHVYQVTD